MPGGPSGPSVILASDGRARGSPEQAGQELGHVGEPWVWLIDCLKEDCRRAIVGDSWHKPGASTCKHKHAQTPPTHRHNHLHTQKKKGFWKVSCGYKVTHYNKKQTFRFLLWTVLLLSFCLEHRVFSATVSRQAHQKGSMHIYRIVMISINLQILWLTSLSKTDWVISLALETIYLSNNK